MDKKSWPWKKKSSDKQATEKGYASASDSPATASDIGATQTEKGKSDSNNNKPKYVQISIESYTRLTGLEDQVKSYEEQIQSWEDEVKELNEKLSEALSEITNKENLAKQHAKVAEEAVSGWEKAEAEAATLKNHVESVTLLRLSAEDQASHLDGALKECMRQIRNLKDEHDLKLNEVVLNKNNIFDKMKLDLEAQIGNFEQELLRSAAENSALSRSLQERSNMLIKLSEQKSQAEAEIELLKSNIESCEKEVSSLKYELHITRKEMEIRNEEKNMSVRAAEVANKQHLDGVKKIAKLEAECQRLRGLVRKKLPGPAALAQMKLEVENMGQDYADTRFRKSQRPHTPHLSQLSEFSLDNSLKYQKEYKLLTERLLAMDEETRILKEALAKQNSELQTSRSICAQRASKLQSLEAQLHANSAVPIEGFSGQRASNPPSIFTMPEEGNDDNVSCAGSCATIALSDLSFIQQDQNAGTPYKPENNNHLSLMDDFLEMEKLAYQSLGPKEILSSSDVSGSTGNARPEFVKHAAPVEVATSTNRPSKVQHSSQPQVYSEHDAIVSNPKLQQDPLIFVNLQAKISTALELLSKEKYMEKLVVDVRNVMQDMLDTLLHQSENDGVKAAPCSDNVQTINQELEVAISNINNFVTILDKEANAVPTASRDGDGLNRSINMFGGRYTEATKSEMNLADFVIYISSVLSKAIELHFSFLGFKSSEVESSSADCIDKIALPDNKAVVDISGERYANGCSHFSDSTTDPDTPGDGNLVPTSELTAKCSLEEFELLKMDKDNLAKDLGRYTVNFESTRCQLLETEQLLADVKSQLTSAQMSNSLAETQLKCMAESYRTLETRAEELQTEVNHLQGKIENLYNELQVEKRNHQHAITRCNDLLEQLQRVGSHAEAENIEKTSQEKELAAAAEKLAQCQETIFLLGKQLNSLRPHTDSSLISLNKEMCQTESSMEEEPINSMNFQDGYSASSFHLHRAGSESPSDFSQAQFSPSDSEANNPVRSPVRPGYPKHWSTKSSSSSASSTPTPEKQPRGFSRFFSSKAKNGK